MNLVNETALLKLPYPGPDDAPCDFDEGWCQFTSAIDGFFDKWEAGLNRAYPAIPGAKMLLTVNTTIQNFNPVPFTEVEFDTAGMTNMDADPYGIVVPRAGRYTIGAFLYEDDASGGGGASSDIIIGFVNEQNQILILGAGAYRNHVYVPVIDLNEGTRITLTSFISAQPIRTARQAWLSVSWHSDRVRPS